MLLVAWKAPSSQRGLFSPTEDEIVATLATSSHDGNAKWSYECTTSGIVRMRDLAPRTFFARVPEGLIQEVLRPSPVTRFFEGGRVSQTLNGVSKTLFDAT